MSRILISKRKLFLFCVLLLGVIIVFTPLWYLSLLIFIVLLLLVLNRLIIRKIFDSYCLISPQRAIKQYNTIVIGENINSSVYENLCDKHSTLFITSPDRTLTASYQILLHLISCITDGGTCIIVSNSLNKQKKEFSLFDIPYIHFITRKELNIEYLNNRVVLPLLYEPVKSLKFLLDIKSSGYKITECHSREIIDFCKRKNISLIYIEK